MKARAGAFAVALAAGLAAPLAVVAPNALAPLLIVCGGIALFARAWPGGRTARAAAAFLAFALLSLLWTIDAREALDGWLRIAGSAALGLALVGAARALDEAGRARVEISLVCGTLLGMALLSAQLASEWAWTREASLAALWHGPETNFWALFNRSVAILALLAPLAALAAHRRAGAFAALALLGGIAFLVFNFNSRGAELALASAVAGSVLIGFFARARALLALGLAGFVLAAPLIAALPVFDRLAETRAHSSSVFHRAAIWSFAADRIAEKPALGWGLHASRAMPGARAQFAPGAETMPLHPHNFALQLWLELGLIGAMAGAAALAALARGIGGGPSTRAALAGALCAAVAIAGVGYGLWQGWWMGALWLLFGLAAALAKERSEC
ncbi:MAG: O-antigen ligase family protein [Tagaea sp.]